MVFCSCKPDYTQQTFGKVSAHGAESTPDYLYQYYILSFVYYNAQIVQVSFNCLVNVSRKREKIWEKEGKKKEKLVDLSMKDASKTSQLKNVFYIPKMYFNICCIPYKHLPLA